MDRSNISGYSLLHSQVPGHHFSQHHIGSTAVYVSDEPQNYALKNMWSNDFAKKGERNKDEGKEL